MKRLLYCFLVFGTMFITACAPPDPNDMSDNGRYQRWKWLKDYGTKVSSGEKRRAYEDELYRLERDVGYGRIRGFEQRKDMELYYEMRNSNPELFKN